MMSILKGRHALVTGASKGIGAQTALCLAGHGINVTMVARGAEELEAAASGIGNQTSSDIHWHAADVTDEKAVGNAFASAEKAIGPVDILINNVGGVESAPFSKTTMSIFSRMVELNLTTVYLCCARALPSMIKNDFGRIVNVASTAGLDGFPFVSAYVAAKHGVVGLTRSLAKEVGPNITVNAVCPGYTDTDMLQSAARHVARQSGRELDAVLDKYREANPSGQLIEASEVAAAILSVCLDSNMRGEAILVDGQKEAQ